MTQNAKDEMRTAAPIIRIGYVERLALGKEFDDGGGAVCNLEIVLIERLGPLSGRTAVLCREVTNLRLGDLIGTCRLQLTIYNIADRGLETERFYVVDEEGLSISLNCADVTIRD